MNSTLPNRLSRWVATGLLVGAPALQAGEQPDAVRCNGFTTEPSAFAHLPPADLLPQTGAQGAIDVIRRGVRYRAARGALVVSGVAEDCPNATARHALCDLGGGGQAVPLADVALTHWAAEFGAGLFSLVVETASDVRDGRAGERVAPGESGARSGFIGYCARADDPIVRITFDGDGATLGNLRHGLAPAASSALELSGRGEVALAQAVFEHTLVDIEVERQAPATGLVPLPEQEPEQDPEQEPEQVPEQDPEKESDKNPDAKDADESLVTDIDAWSQHAREIHGVLAEAAAEAAERIGRARAARMVYGSHDGVRASTPDDLLARSVGRVDKAMFSPDTAPVEAISAADVPHVNHLAFASLEVWEIYAGAPYMVKACATAGPCIWPLPYDLRPRQLYINWRSSTLTVQQMADVVTQNGFTMTLSMDGQPLNLGPLVGYSQTPPAGQDAWAGNFATNGCPTGNVCMTTAVFAPGNLDGEVLPWTFELSVHEVVPLQVPIIELDKWGNPQPVYHTLKPFGQASVHVNSGPASHLSFFEELLWPTYQHDRCSDCHGFGDWDALGAHHNFGPNSGDAFKASVGGALEPSAYVAGANVMTCAFHCHSVPLTDNHGDPFNETQWKAPYFDLDIDWRSKTAAQACDRTVTNLPTAALRHDHFHEDGRLFWAVEAPVIGSLSLPPAPPYDHDTFMARIDIWNDNGALCP